MQPRLCCHLARQRHLPSIGRIARCLLVTLQRRLMSHLSQPFLYDLRHIASGSCQAQRDITLGSRYHSLDNVKEGFYNVSLTKFVPLPTHSMAHHLSPQQGFGAKGDIHI